VVAKIIRAEDEEATFLQGQPGFEFQSDFVVAGEWKALFTNAKHAERS
jgi:hypothetical protein